MDKQTDRLTDILTDKEMSRKRMTEIQKGRHIERWTAVQTHRQILVWKTGNCADKQKD